MSRHDLLALRRIIRLRNLLQPEPRTAHRIDFARRHNLLRADRRWLLWSRNNERSMASVSGGKCKLVLRGRRRFR